jgi:hypothetical protein
MKGEPHIACSRTDAVIDEVRHRGLGRIPYRAEGLDQCSGLWISQLKVGVRLLHCYRTSLIVIIEEGALYRPE